MQSEESIRQDRLQKEPGDWSWASIVYHALEALDGTAPLNAIYGVIHGHRRSSELVNWKAAVRRTLQAHRETFCEVGPGTWSFTRLHSPEDVSRFETLRSERCPRRTKFES
jgi:hypothetical protein